MTDNLWSHPNALVTPWALDQRRLANARALLQTRAKSTALLHGGLRWIQVGDDSLTFLRESPSETVIVIAARVTHTPVRIPASVIGSHLTRLAESSDFRADTDSMVTLPSDGPAFGMWRLAA